MYAVDFRGLPDLGVTISGDPETPTITNSTDRRVVSYVLYWEARSPGGQTVRTRTEHHTALQQIRNGVPVEQTGVAPYGSRINTPSNIKAPDDPLLVEAVILDSVVFEDGEFAGPDRANYYRIIRDMNNLRRELYLAVASDRNHKVDDIVRAWYAAHPSPDPYLQHMAERQDSELAMAEAAGQDVHAMAETWASRMVVIHKKGEAQ